MFKKIIASSILSALLVAAPAQAASLSYQVSITVNGQEVSHDEYRLGWAYDRQSHSIVEGRAIVHRDKNFSHLTRPARTSASRCYSYVARNTKWRSVEPWMMNPTNSRGLDTDTLFTVQEAALAKWEDAADGTVGNGSGVEITGVGSNTNDILVADESSPDGKNEVYFADIDPAGAIAVTIIWYNVFTRTLVEWDQVFDDVDYNWSLTGESGKMDFDNLATHEDGHSVGMGDLYRSSCADATMYGYADFGETKKQTLEIGDITGIDKLY